jgi:hypothetical protein
MDDPRTHKLSFPKAMANFVGAIELAFVEVDIIFDASSQP